MPNPKTYILNDQATETDALDFTPYVETLADVCKTTSIPLTIVCSAHRQNETSSGFFHYSF